MSFKEFWQRYRGEIGKLFVTHAAISVFSIMCSAPLFTTDPAQLSSLNTILILASVFVFAFYYYLIRSQLWTLGAKNKISADGGRLKLCPLAGLYMGLMASIPSFLLNITYIVSYIYKDYPGFAEVCSITAKIEWLWDAPALGLRFATGSPFAYLASSILPALFAGIAYYCGTKEFALFGVPQKNR